MGNRSLGGDTGGLWKEVKLVTVTNYESIRMYELRIHEMRMNTKCEIIAKSYRF